MKVSSIRPEAALDEEDMEDPSGAPSCFVYLWDAAASDAMPSSSCQLPSSGVNNKILTPLDQGQAATPAEGRIGFISLLTPERLLVLPIAWSSVKAERTLKSSYRLDAESKTRADIPLRKEMGPTTLTTCFLYRIKQLPIPSHSCISSTLTQGT